MTNKTIVKNKKVYIDFIKNNKNNCEFKNKYIAIVHGKYQDSDYNEDFLVQKMYRKFGNVHTYIAHISGKVEVLVIDTPDSIYTY